jgi:hypothetical protein
MNSLAAWAPAIVAIVAMLITFGRYSQTQTTHEKRLDAHDARFDETDERVGAKFEAHGQHLQRVDIALVKLEEYNRGLADGIHMAKHKGPNQ